MKSSIFQEFHNRFFFLCGRTDDEFFTGSLEKCTIEEVVHRHLKDDMGYCRVVFFNGKNKIHYFDHDSKRLCSPDQGKPQPDSLAAPSGNPRICAGPLGKKKIVQRASHSSPTPAPNNTDSLLREGMGDLEMAPFFDQLMGEARLKTAIVFSNGLDFISHTSDAAVRQLAANLSEWKKLGSDNKNICLFILPDLGSQHLEEVLGRHTQWSFLRNMLFHENGAFSTRHVHLVGAPQRDEIENLFHYHRIMRALETDWCALGAMVDSVSRIARSGMLMGVGNAQKNAGLSLKKLAFDFSKISAITPLEVAALLKNWTSEIAIDNTPAFDRLRAMRGIGNLVGRLEKLIGQFLEEKRHFSHAGLQPNQRATVGRLMPPPPAMPFKTCLHLVLKGSPGTGKTEAAKLIGEIYRDAGLLESGHTVKVTRADLVAGFVGQTAIRTAERIADAMGGVLFVDEAYTLSQGGDGDFGKEAIETIMEAMTAQAGRFAVVTAGYPDEMESFLDANPGLRRRFGEKNIIAIPDYTPDILQPIFEGRVAQEGRTLDAALAALLPFFFENWFAARDPHTFGNAGDVIHLYQEMDENRVARVMALPQHEALRMVLTREDIPERHQRHLTAPKTATVEEALALVDDMVGLAAVKATVRTMVNQIKVAKKQKGRSGTPAPGHYVFAGNPGTGKTTVARKMGEIFRALGILKKGHVVEVGRKDLVRGYQGQTAIAANEMLESALEGVLFIDEAYQLINGEQDSFGKEALETLVASMENHRSHLCVIVAGYPAPMKSFLESNPGLDSRFSGTILFEDYSADEMFRIFAQMAADQGAILGYGVSEKVMDVFIGWEGAKTENFGNARDVRKLLDTMQGRKSNRLAKIIDSLPDNDPGLFRLEVGDVGGVTPVDHRTP